MSDKPTYEEVRTNMETLRHIENIRRYISVFARELIHRGDLHDNSKMSDVEFNTFVEYTPKLKNSEYGSEEYKGFLKAMKPALDHHYANNRHHPEWVRANYEEWRPVVGYEGVYEVSNFGELRSVRRKVDRSGSTGSLVKPAQSRKPHVTPKGYLRLQLVKNKTSKNHFVHRVVAEAFLGPPLDETQQVNHKNGNKLDNSVWNLEWVTPAENLQHAYDEGLRKSNVKYVVHCVEEDLTTIGIQKMVDELRRRGYSGVNCGCVWKCLTGDSSSHKGLTFVSENLTTYTPPSDVSRMNLIDVMEMLIDWKAATLRHETGDIMRSIKLNQERFGIGDELAQIMRNTVELFDRIEPVRIGGEKP